MNNQMAVYLSIEYHKLCFFNGNSYFLGCTAVVRLENLSHHLHECEYNPKKPIVCSFGCNTIIPKDELKNHNCIKELKKIIDDQQSKITTLSTELAKQKHDLEYCVNELKSLKVKLNY